MTCNEDYEDSHLVFRCLCYLTLKVDPAPLTWYSVEGTTIAQHVCLITNSLYTTVLTPTGIRPAHNIAK